MNNPSDLDVNNFTVLQNYLNLHKEGKTVRLLNKPDGSLYMESTTQKWLKIGFKAVKIASAVAVIALSIFAANPLIVVTAGFYTFYIIRDVLDKQEDIQIQEKVRHIAHKTLFELELQALDYADETADQTKLQNDKNAIVGKLQDTRNELSKLLGRPSAQETLEFNAKKAGIGIKKAGIGVKKVLTREQFTKAFIEFSKFLVGSEVTQGFAAIADGATTMAKEKKFSVKACKKVLLGTTVLFMKKLSSLAPSRFHEFQGYQEQADEFNNARV